MKNLLNLIPRYNWDYDLPTCINALKAIINKSTRVNGCQQVFNMRPIYTTSGRASLYTILKALNLPRGALVGVPLFCCSVVFDAILQAGLQPEFVDIDQDDYAISANDLQKKVNHISAVIVVHMFGHPVKMSPILSICNKLPVIEDCAQSLFSRYEDRFTGSLSTASFFSFRSGKYLSVGEGSAIFCNEPDLHDSIEKIIDTFQSYNPIMETLNCVSTYVKSTLYHKPWYGIIGYPLGRRLDRTLNLTAKSGFKLKKIARSHLSTINDRITNFQALIEKQRDHALFFLENLKMKGVILPRENNNVRSNYFQFAIRFETQQKRDFIADHLLKHGVDTAKYLDDIADIARTYYGYSGGCTNTELCSKTILSIPNHYTLTINDLMHIVDRLHQADKLYRE